MKLDKANITISIVSLSKKDLPEMYQLFTSVRNNEIRIDEFKKKYNTDWTKTNLLCVGAKINDELIGMCPSTLYKYYDKTGKEFKIPQLGDLVVDKKYQGSGVFGKMLKVFEEIAIEREFDAVMVFPNPSAQHIFEKVIGWSRIGEFMRYDFKVNSFPLLKLLNKLGYEKSFYTFSKWLGSYEFPNTEWNKLSNISIAIISSQEYFNYKKYQPYLFHRYKKKEFLWSLSDGIIINRSQVQTTDELVTEIKTLKTFCRKRGVHQFTYICHSRSNLNTILSNRFDGEKGIPMYFFGINTTLDPSMLDINGFERNAF